MKRYLCIDVGGTAVKYGLVDGSGAFLERSRMPSEAESGGGPAVLRMLFAIVENTLARSSVDGICIATAGVVDDDRGCIVHSAPIIPNYIGTPIRDEVQARFSIPCEVENDVNCACLAEYRFGAAKGRRSCLCLTVGTGIGGAYIEDGHLLRGSSHFGCEVGYLHLPGGAFQDQASAAALLRDIERRKGMPPHSVTGEWAFAAARDGDRDCADAIAALCETLGMGIANICLVLNPQTVVLGGGILAQWELLRRPIRASLDRYLPPYAAEHTELTAAQFGNDAGMLGAYVHFLQKQRERRPASSEES